MIRYIIRRLLISIPILLIGSFACYVLVASAGNPLAEMRFRPGVTEADLKAAEISLGLDKPVVVQYFVWLGRALIGDLGVSISTDMPVAEEVMRALMNTITLAVIAVIIAFVVSLVLGLVAAYRMGGLVDRFATGIAVLGISVPNFWLGVVLVIIFAVQLGWLPATGMGAGGSDAGAARASQTPRRKTPRGPAGSCEPGVGRGAMRPEPAARTCRAANRARE